MLRIPAFLIGYLFGNFLFGYFYSRAKNTDITRLGSGNPGSTNTLRVMGVGPGFMTLASDCLKVVLAYFVCMLIFSRAGIGGDFLKILCVYASFGAVIGHDFPVILKMKGGKGIASSLGFFIVVCPRMLFIALLVFLLTVLITRYVSLGSILAAASLFIQALVFYRLGITGLSGSYATEVLIMMLVLSSLAIALHHANIGRLVHGNENKFSFHNAGKGKKNG